MRHSSVRTDPTPLPATATRREVREAFVLYLACMIVTGAWVGIMSLGDTPTLALVMHQHLIANFAYTVLTCLAVPFCWLVWWGQLAFVGRLAQLFAPDTMRQARQSLRRAVWVMGATLLVTTEAVFASPTLRQWLGILAIALTVLQSWLVLRAIPPLPRELIRGPLTAWPIQITRRARWIISLLFALILGSALFWSGSVLLLAPKQAIEAAPPWPSSQYVALELVGLLLVLAGATWRVAWPLFQRHHVPASREPTSVQT